jgi:Domain of unknown function (DUF5668)/B-box zinc finger
MNCQNHPETPATAYCRACGKPVCDQCRHDTSGTVYCADHVPAPAAEAAPPGPNPGPTGPPPVYVAPPAVGGAASPHGVSYAYADVSPGLAFFLGMIPGVGAIYNGQYAKGIVHAVIWGVLMSMANSRAINGMEPLFGVVVAAWWFYMAFEAYHTARRRRAGEPVDEYSSILNLTGARHHVPVAGILLIALGGVLLLHTLDVLDFEYVARFWPVVLIAAGVYLLAGRFLPGATQTERGHER